MPEAASFPYRRLPGSLSVFRRVFNTSSSLWLGDDHLLERKATYFSESYKRFSYGDVQALLLRETSRGLVMNVILGTLAAGSGLLAWSMENTIARESFAGIAAFWLALLAVNVARGQTCRCHLQTAAGPHVLPSLSRVRPARKAWRLILEKVDAAQGALSAEDTAREMR